MNRIFLAIVIFSLNSFGQTSVANKIQGMPKIESYINDFENILALHQEVILNTSIEQFVKGKNIGIVVVTVESVEPHKNVGEYAFILSNSSNLGSVLIVVSKKLKQIQIQIGDDIIDKFTEEEAKNITEKFMQPEFQNDNYFKGLNKGISEIKKELN